MGVTDRFWRHDPVIDAMKGIAMILVVADHCGVGACAVTDYFNVPAFFVLAGMVFRMPEGFGILFRNKFKRLMVPYVVYNLLYMAVVSPDGVSPSGILTGLAMPADYPLWFLKTMFMMYLAVWMGRKVIFRGGIACAALMIGVVAGVILMQGINMPVALIHTGVMQALAALPLFVSGYFMARMPHCCVDGRNDWLCVVGGAVVVAVCALAWHGLIAFDNFDLGDPVVFYPYTLVLFTGVRMLVGGARRSVVVPVLAWMGRNTMLVLCIHAIVIYVVRELCVDAPWSLFAVTSVICYAVAWLSEKLPAVRRLCLA